MRRLTEYVNANSMLALRVDCSQCIIAVALNGFQYTTTSNYKVSIPDPLSWKESTTTNLKILPCESDHATRSHQDATKHDFGPSETSTAMRGIPFFHQDCLIWSQSVSALIPFSPCPNAWVVAVCVFDADGELPFTSRWFFLGRVRVVLV